MNKPRRQFIKELTLAGTFATTLSAFNTRIALATEGPGKKIRADKGTIFLFQGDSITDGNRGRNEDPNHIMGHGYAFAIAARIGADHPDMDYQFYNRGISGNTVVDLAQRWQTDTLDLKPDVLSILVGVNDSTYWLFNWANAVSVSRYGEVYASLLEKTLEKYPDILFALGLPFILKVGNVGRNWDAYHSDILQRQEIVRQLAEKHKAVLIDYQDLFNEASEEAPAEYWIWDGIHPTVPGHELMAREWISCVRKRLVIR